MTSVLAHRGSTERHRENTLEAFLEARRLGADGIELDVRRSADGALVVHHDAELPDGRLLPEVAVADLPEHVPLLGEVLEACHGMVVNVEIKNAPGDPGYEPDQAIAALVAAAVHDAGWTEGVIVSCFQADTLDAVRAADPSLPLGWLLGFAEEPGAAVDEAARRGFQALHPFFSAVDDQLVALAGAAGLALNVWTVNSRVDLRRMVGLGVDALITDNLPEALVVAHGS